MAKIFVFAIATIMLMLFASTLSEVAIGACACGLIIFLLLQDD